MPTTAVVGANWGDEGKGKFTDLLAAEADYVVRFQGGRNAGHTIVNDYGKFALHLLPSGVFYPHVINVVGPGVALDIPAFLSELETLVGRGVPMPQLRVSNRAQVVLPYHIAFDAYEEERLGAGQFGSTRCGIAPFYADKYLKIGVQVADLYHPARLKERVARALDAKNALLKHLYAKPEISANDILPPLIDAAKELEPFVCDTTDLLRSALARNQRILLEGQLGALRDPDHGIYPFVTSSSPLAGFATVGAGIFPSAIQRVVAVTKAYSSCVGAGPFVTELTGEPADTLRTHGGEYGATTGRPRRVGWFDAVATRYGCHLQGATEVAVGLLDVLSYLDKIPVCVAYDLDGHVSQDFPLSPLLDAAKPIYETLPGWSSDITAARAWTELPRQAQRYIARIEELVGLPVSRISVGPRRDSVLNRP